MFSFTRKSTIEAPITLLRPTRLSQRPAPVPRFDEYLALAAELDTASHTTGKVLQRAVVDFLWEQDIEIFSHHQVCRYLSQLAEKQDEFLCWRPLRNRDIPVVSALDPQGNWGWGRAKEHDYYKSTLWECRPYGEAVPFDVLHNVRKIEQKFPGKLHFFVSDISDPDPFIILTARDTDRIVFGAWNEPAFFKERGEGGA